MSLVGKITATEAFLLTGTLTNKHGVRVQLYLTLLVLDCLVLAAIFVGIAQVGSSSWLTLAGVNLCAMIIPIYIGVSINGQAYSLQALTRPSQAAARAVMFLFFAMLAVQCVLYFAHASAAISRLSFGGAIAVSGMILAFMRHPFSRYALRRAGGRLTSELIIKDGIEVEVSAGEGNLLIVDAAEYDLRADLNDPWMLHRLGGWLRTFDRVVVACPPERRHSWSILLRGSSIQGEILVEENAISGAIGIGTIDGQETHVVSRGALDLANRAKKRAFDLIVTVAALIFLAPLLLLVALAIKLESRGPVLFFQDRIGLGNRLFKIAKFRSMQVESCDLDGSSSTSRSDNRVTRVGRIIRKTSIDELPQLFNVLRGDMSIVGPRPHALGSTADAKLFWQISEYYWCRHALKPGITGLAQVRGFRGATEKIADLENRLAADLEYLKDWSLTREILIVLRTFNVLAHKNAF